MADQPIHNPKDFSESLPQLTIDTPVHADILNPMWERLINNDAFVKALAEAAFPKSGGELSGPLTLPNGVALNLKEKGGTARIAVVMGTDDKVYLGVVNNPTVIRSSVDPTVIVGAATNTLLHSGNHNSTGDPHTQYAKKNGEKFTGETSFDGGGQVINLKPGTLDHVYMSLYSDTENPNVRSGYFGYAGGGTKILTIGNEMTDGDIALTPNGAGLVVAYKPMRVQAESDSAQLALQRTTTAAGKMYIGADANGFHVFDGTKNRKATITPSGDGAFSGGLNVQLKITKSGKDANGRFTTVEYRRPDNTLFLRSVSSNPDANGNYQTDTCTYYAADGVAVSETKVWTVTYDADGDIISVA